MTVNRKTADELRTMNRLGAEPYLNSKVKERGKQL